MWVVNNNRKYKVRSINGNILSVNRGGIDPQFLLSVEEVEPYIEPRQAKYTPLSEMSDEEFDELLKLGYEVEYKKCVPDTKEICQGITAFSDDDWKTCKPTIDGRR